MPEMYAVDTGYAYGGVLVKEGVVISAPPIFNWMKGKAWAEVKKWRKIQHVTRVVTDPESRDIPEQ